MSFSFSCFSFCLIILPPCLDALTLCCKNACTTRAAVSSLLEAFHLRLHLRASVIAQWHQHLQTPVVLIRLSGNFKRNTKGMLLHPPSVRMFYETLGMSQAIYPGAGLFHKKPFSAEQVHSAQSEPCVIPRRGGLQSCRALQMPGG